MNTPSPAIQSLARQLVSREPAIFERANGDPGQAEGAIGKLRVPLTKLIGAAGFASLLSRALALAKRQAPSLEGLRVEADGLLAGFNEVQEDSGAAEAGGHAGAVILAELLGLLVTFIGQPLTLSLVRQAWPDASVETMMPSAEENG